MCVPLPKQRETRRDARFTRSRAAGAGGGRTSACPQCSGLISRAGGARGGEPCAAAPAWRRRAEGRRRQGAVRWQARSRMPGAGQEDALPAAEGRGSACLRSANATPMTPGTRSLLPQVTESAELAKMNSVESSIVIDATPEECFAAATGFEVDSLCVHASACARLHEARTHTRHSCT